MNDMLEVMKARHSVRQYTDKAIEKEKRDVLNTLINEINRKESLHIQVLYDEPECFDSFMAHYGKFSGVRNYITLIGKKSSDLDEKIGYFGEEIVLKAQMLGLNSCWVAMTHGKSRAIINKGEKLVCLIALGYGVTNGVAHTSKPLSKLCDVSDNNIPDWFKKGMEASSLAPTAMNQQKFRFELSKDGTVRLTCQSGFYTKLDKGIVRYHFEAVSGRKVTEEK